VAQDALQKNHRTRQMKNGCPKKNMAAFPSQKVAMLRRRRINRQQNDVSASASPGENRN
jgi:hypothetical protein